MIIENQKSVAKNILNKLKVLDDYAVLAGGACRDWYLGKVATDLDFYIYYNPLYTQAMLKRKIGELLGIKLEVVGRKLELQALPEDESECLYTADPNIELVLGGEKAGVPVQIIIMNKPYLDVRKFCFDICQAYSKDGEIIHTTKAFDEAIKHKVIRITGEFYMQKESYIKKIKARFPDYLHVGF